jgi:guanine nucleotide-binding protein subunit alpha
MVQYKAARKDQFEKRQRSLAIDRFLKRYWNLRVRNERNILLLGADHKGKKEIMEVVRGFSEDTYTTDELAGYRLTIYKILIDSVKALVGAMDKFGIVPDSDESKSYCAYLKYFTVPPADPQKPLEPKVGEAIAALRTDSCIAQAMEHSNNISISEDAMQCVTAASSRLV